MPYLLLHSDSNIGKTNITAKFKRTNPNQFVDKPASSMCRKIDADAAHAWVHHLSTGSYPEQSASLNLPKYLASGLQISMVLIGTRHAVLALQIDAQMLSRNTPFEIPRWRAVGG